MRRIGWLAVAVLLGAACGTGSTDLDVVEPTATLFSESDSTQTSDTTATTSVAPIGVETFDLSDLPGPFPDAPGVVVLGGIAAPVSAAGADGWVVETPCGAGRSGLEPSPRTAVVALDPTGDAGDGAGAEALRRNALIAEAIQARLTEAGVDSIVTRPAGADVPAAFRSQAATAAGARVVVSIALVDGVAASDAAPALEVVHPAADADGRRLAGLVYAETEPAIARLAVAWPADVEAGVRAVLNQRGDDFFTMLRESGDSARAVVHLPVDPTTADVFINDANVAPIAAAVADAIVQFLVSSREGAGFVAPAEVVRDAPVAEPVADCVDPLVDGG